jgi:hypothetical protein
MPYKTEALKKLIKNTLKRSYVVLDVQGYEIYEQLRGTIKSETELHIAFSIKTCGDESKIHKCICRGSGFVDALFHGLLAYIKELGDITFPTSFSPTIAHFNVGASGISTTDKAQSVLAVYSRSQRMEPHTFEAEDFSINAATVRVVVQAVEFFINAHLSYTAVSDALQDSRRRGRVDLVEMQTRQLIELVQIADYSTIIKKRN